MTIEISAFGVFLLFLFVFAPDLLLLPVAFAWWLFDLVFGTNDKGGRS